MPALLPPRSLPGLLLCAALTAGLSFHTAPASAAQLQVKHGSTVIAENSTYDFGSTLVGEDLSVTISVKNVGSSPVSLGGYSIGSNTNDPGRFHVGDINMPSPLPVGATGTVELIYRATGPGTVTNSFRLFDGGIPDWEFFPRATGTEPLGPIPRVAHADSPVPHNSTFQYGSTPLGTDIVETFVVFNDGDEDLTIGTYGFSYSGNPLNSFSVENANVVNVPPGGSGSFDLRFHADAVETTTWKVRLFIGGVSRYEYWVTGTVQPPPMPDIRIKQGSTTIPSGGTYNAGLIGYNDPLTVTFTALNQGDADLHISNVDFTGDRLELVQAPPASIPDGGGTGTFKLRLKADIEGPHSPLVKVWSDDPDENPYEFFLSWTVDDALGPILRVQLGGNVITQGELVNFGNTGVGMPLSRTFTAYNDGDQPLSIGAISIGSHTNDPAGFDVGFNNVQNVQPGGNAQFRLDFDAAGLGSVTSEIDLFVGGISRREFFVKGTVLPPDYEISVAPASRTVEPGQNAFYTVSVDPLFGFTGTVGLSISNLPSGTNHTFTPVNVSAGSTSQLKVRTFASTPPVTNHTFTVTGSHGGTNRSDTAKITVAPPGDFQIDVTPGLRTISPGSSTGYTVTLTPTGGFNQSVNLSRSGLPAGATASFSPSSVTPPGTSTLTVNTATTTPLGDSTLTITGTGGGRTHSDQATLRLVETPAGEPEVTSVTPDTIQAGQVRNLVIQGANFQGAVVTVATTPADPGDPLPPVFPDVTLLSINGAGTEMVVEVDATAPGVSGFYNLSIETAAGSMGAPFRVIGNGPEVDIWTPKEPARGGLYSLSMLGVNLAGARISVSGGGGVEAFVTSTGGRFITGFLDVASNAPLGPRTLVVSRGGHQTQVPISIVASMGASPLKTTNVTEGAAKKAAKKGEKVPVVLLQEFSAREDLAWAGQNSEGFELLCSFTLGWVIYSYNYTIALPFDPLTGRVVLELLRSMNLGIPLPTGVRIFSAFADLVLQIKFNFCPVSHIQICLFGNIGYEIPGIFGQIFTAGGCFFGGGFFPTFSTTGTVSNFNFRNDGQCTNVTQTTPPTIGEQEAQVVMNACCTENLRIDTFGSSFDGTIYNYGWSANNHPVAEMSPAPEECPCTCGAQVNPVVLEPGQTVALEAFIDNLSDDTTCTYQWSLSKHGTQGPTPTFSPASGTVSLPPGGEQDVGGQISLPSSISSGQQPNIALTVTHAGHQECQAQTPICILPTSETSRFITWGGPPPEPDVASFKGKLLPTANWEGVEVTENPIGSGTGAFDNCYTPELPAHLELTNGAISGGTWTVGSDQEYGIGNHTDNIGFFMDIDGVYGAFDRLPCTMGVTQHMKLVCPAALGWREYKANDFTYDIRSSGSLICRDGTCPPTRH